MTDQRVAMESRLVHEFCCCLANAFWGTAMAPTQQLLSVHSLECFGGNRSKWAIMSEFGREGLVSGILRGGLQLA